MPCFQMLYCLAASSSSDTEAPLETVSPHPKLQNSIWKTGLPGNFLRTKMISWNNDISVYFLPCNSYDISIFLCLYVNVNTICQHYFNVMFHGTKRNCSDRRTGHRKESSAKFTCAIFGFDSKYNNNLLNMSWFLKSNITDDTNWLCRNDVNRRGSRCFFFTQWQCDEATEESWQGHSAHC